MRHPTFREAFAEESADVYFDATSVTPSAEKSALTFSVIEVEVETM